MRTIQISIGGRGWGSGVGGPGSPGGGRSSAGGGSGSPGGDRGSAPIVAIWQCHMELQNRDQDSFTSDCKGSGNTLTFGASPLVDAGGTAGTH